MRRQAVPEARHRCSYRPRLGDPDPDLRGVGAQCPARGVSRGTSGALPEGPLSLPVAGPAYYRSLLGTLSVEFIEIMDCSKYG